jgi:hypothetical protein
MGAGGRNVFRYGLMSRSKESGNIYEMICSCHLLSADMDLQFMSARIIVNILLCNDIITAFRILSAVVPG